MLDTLRESHERLDRASVQAVRDITNLAATMKVLESADDHSIRTALESSASTLDALAEFLEAVAAAVAAPSESIERGTLLGLAEELEPRAGDAVDDAAGSGIREPSEAEADDPFQEVPPLRRLSAPYSVLLNLERDLYADRSRRPFRIRKLKELWGDLTRVGSAHPSEGLAARLNRFTEYVEEAVEGRDIETPWADSDIEAVRQLAERALAILDWESEELARREREAWLERVRDWVETLEEQPESATQLSEMLTRFLTDRPREGSEAVVDILERIAALEALPEDLEERTRRALDDYP